MFTSAIESTSDLTWKDKSPECAARIRAGVIFLPTPTMHTRGTDMMSWQIVNHVSFSYIVSAIDVWGRSFAFSQPITCTSGLPLLRSCWGEAFPARGPQWNLSISVEISTWLPNVNSECQDGGAHWATLSIYWRVSQTFIRKVLLAVTVHLPNRVCELRNWLTRTQILGKPGYSKCRALTTQNFEIESSS